MGQIMYMPHAREILDIPDVRVICATQRHSMDFPMVDVRYHNESIGYLGRDFMDDRPHREWVESRNEVPSDVPFRDIEMWMRPSWRKQMARIEVQLPPRLRQSMRKRALKLGFKWWLN